MARKTITPEQYRKTVVRAIAVAKAKGLTAELKQARELLAQIDADMARQAK